MATVRNKVKRLAGPQLRSALKLQLVNLDKANRRAHRNPRLALGLKLLTRKHKRELRLPALLRRLPLVIEPLIRWSLNVM